MAPKRQTQPKKEPSPSPPPPESSDDVVEEEDEEDQSDSGEESDQEQEKKQSESEASDDDDEGDESVEEEDDSESEPEQRSTPNPQQPSAAPAPAPAPPVTTAAANGSLPVESSESESESDSESDGAPLKTASEETAKKPFQRIWSEDDATTLLKGMIDYVELKGKDPVANLEGFWLFIRKSFSFPCTELQLMRKIQSLKTKFRVNKGKDKVFGKPHEAQMFELSKKIWGVEEDKMAASENGGGKKRKANEVLQNVVAVDDESIDFVVAGRSLCEDEMVNACRRFPSLDEHFVRAKVRMIEEAKLKTLEAKWRELRRGELRVLANRAALEADTLLAFANAYS